MPSRRSKLNIKVLNLSLSSGSPLPYQFDPLTLALEGLWSRGITVVVPAGNDGPDAGTISSPGNDPTLLTVGSLDEGGTASRSDDTVSPFSSRGPAAQGVAKPDLVSPGSHLISLRAPGSVVDTENPTSRVGDSYFRGSGTSMSTALTSGVVADLLSARPDLSPDQVKAILTSSAYDAAGLADVTGAGAGGVDANAAFTAPTPTIAATVDDFPSGQDGIWNKFSSALLSGDRCRCRLLVAEALPRGPFVGRPVLDRALARKPVRGWHVPGWPAPGSARTERPMSGSRGAGSPDPGSPAPGWTMCGVPARGPRVPGRRAPGPPAPGPRSATGPPAPGPTTSWTARSWTARSWTARSWTTVDWS